MKTAVEYLVNAWVEQGTLYAEDIVKAKEMEKQQIIEAHIEGFYSPPFGKSRKGEAEQYYNETFKTE